MLPVCGNYILEENEECDDGNRYIKDGCSSNCTIEEPGTICGDGIYYPLYETCDDGNKVEGDGCYECIVEIGWECNLTPEGLSICSIVPVCGNGIIEKGEKCDDKNLNNKDGCDEFC
mmetsp:Transcript_8769/g.1229  ORF Transcript_8769/g.1229 Transcript_8769/m.1229 type:complete len:117 (+) Transcript_8769:230-580(+)